LKERLDHPRSDFSTSLPAVSLAIGAVGVAWHDGVLIVLIVGDGKDGGQDEREVRIPHQALEVGEVALSLEEVQQRFGGRNVLSELGETSVEPIIFS
jgi:hypothetical protein